MAYSSAMAGKVRIIGIDPGLRRCGWGIIESEGNRLRFVAAGTVTPPHDGRAGRAGWSSSSRGSPPCFAQHRPDEAAVEETFVNQGARSALLLGQARGVALMTPASLGLPVARVRREPRQEIGGRHRPRREGADRS